MSGHAEAVFRLSRRDKDGHRECDVLEGLLKRTRRESLRQEIIAALYVPPLPPAVAYLWTVYLRLRNRKASNGFAAAPLEWPDIDAFCRQVRRTLRTWEIEVIEAVDDAFLAAQAGSGEEHP